MADIEVEAEFVGAIWGEAIAGTNTAMRVLAHIRSEMFEWRELGTAYEFIANRYARGDPLADLEVESYLCDLVGEDWYVTLRDRAQYRGKIGSYVKRVLYNWRARRQAAFLTEVRDRAISQLGKADDKAHKIADDVISKLATLHTSNGDLDRPVTRKEITERALSRLQKQERKGIRWPFAKLQEQMGDLLPGDVVGIAGYSNSGKSLFAANLWRLFALAGIPTISFPTEMGLSWHARAVAAHTKIAQLVIEREQWDMLGKEQAEAYEFALRDLGNCPWEIIDRPAITVPEIMARTSVLRRQWEGKLVVLIVDHMHRLDYGGEDPDKACGPATRELRNWVRDDEHGGMVALLLYQPRKPLDDLEFYKPVSLYQIRGRSEIGNEIDYLISPYRRWVKADGRSKTPWGTPATFYDENGWPQYTAPNAQGSKLDDERVYLKIGKRRVGGEGPTVVEQVDAPSGQIFELVRPKLAVVGKS